MAGKEKAVLFWGINVEIPFEWIMFFGIGFLVAALVGIACFPFVHNRAVRLTTQRLDSAAPTSITEMQAEKDQLRAEFAMSTRRLETITEELRTNAHAQMAALAKRSSVIARLKSELDERTAKIHTVEQRESALEAREKSLFDQLRASKEEVTRVSDALHASERVVGEMRASRNKLESTVEERSRLVESQQMEIAALRTHVDSIRHHVYELASGVKDAERRTTQDWIELKNAANGHGKNGAANGSANGNGTHASKARTYFSGLSRTSWPSWN
jgi:DNA repair exonuclease SbcCD ATPase subunit